MLAIVALLLQTTMWDGMRSKPKTAGIDGNCVSTQIALELGASVQKSGDDTSHARKHWLRRAPSLRDKRAAPGAHADRRRDRRHGNFSSSDLRG